MTRAVTNKFSSRRHSTYDYLVELVLAQQPPQHNFKLELEFQYMEIVELSVPLNSMGLVQILLESLLVQPLSAGSGAQRVVVTSLTSGTMTSAATDAELTYNSGTNTLSATTFSGALTGNVCHSNCALMLGINWNT